MAQKTPPTAKKQPRTALVTVSTAVILTSAVGYGVEHAMVESAAPSAVAQADTGPGQSPEPLRHRRS